MQGEQRVLKLATSTILLSIRIHVPEKSLQCLEMLLLDRMLLKETRKYEKSSRMTSISGKKNILEYFPNKRQNISETYW